MVGRECTMCFSIAFSRLREGCSSDYSPPSAFSIHVMDFKQGGVEEKLRLGKYKAEDVESAGKSRIGTGVGQGGLEGKQEEVGKGYRNAAGGVQAWLWMGVSKREGWGREVHLGSDQCLLWWPDLQ